MSEQHPRPPLRAPLHQPPNPADLRREPPANSDCARVRGLMRDFADGDLDAAARREVEEHAHRCHVCAVELSRAEHEVVRLRRAFAQMQDEESAAVPPLGRDFASRVVQRLVLDETSSFPTEAVVAAVRVGAARARAAARPAPARFAPSVLLSVAAALLVLVAGAAWWFGGDDRAPDRSARLVVTEARGAIGPNGRRWGVGDGLGEAQLLSVGAAGEAHLEWHDVSSGSQPAAMLELDGNASLMLQDGAPVLLNGTVRIETLRPVSLSVKDGALLQFGVGEYLVAADAVDTMLAEGAALQDPLASAPSDLRFELEVLSGESARITRSDIGPTLVAQGTVGVYGGGAVTTRPSLSGGANSEFAGRGPETTQVASAQPTISAFVNERSGVPSVGTTMLLAYAAHSAAHLGYGATNANGAFVLNTEFAAETDFAVMQATPPATRLELGLRAPDAYRLLRQGAEARCTSSILLDVSAPLSGTVVDEQGDPKLGARVVPCVVDELFGTLLPLLGRLAYTDQDGRFEIRQLPVQLPKHQYLALLLAYGGLQPVVVPVPVRGDIAALLPLGSLVLPPLRTIRLHQLPAHTTVTVLEEIDDLPRGSAAWQRTFTTDAYGRVSMAAVGTGDLWVRVGSDANAILLRLVLDEMGSGGGSPRYHPSSTVSPMASVFDPLSPLPGADVLLTSTFRHQVFQCAPVETASGLALRVVDSLDRAVPEAQVFAVTPTGPRGRAAARFLGFTSANGVMSLEAVSQGGDVVVIAPDGAASYVASPQQELLQVHVTVSGLGRVLVAPNLRPMGNAADRAVPVRLQSLGPVLPGLEVSLMRFACEASGWEVTGIPPGTYRVTVGENSPRMVIVSASGLGVVQ